jgi:hypothetical protein
MCAVAPVPASSGKTRRHRLNRGGNREASHALWRIAVTRMSGAPPPPPPPRRVSRPARPEDEGPCGR